MEKLKLIYNPGSGDRSFRNNIDPCIEIFQKHGYLTDIFRSSRKEDIGQHIEDISDQNYDVIVISGGDGSINLTVNAMKRCGLDTPLGIIPSGTANDFANFFHIPHNPAKAAQVIAARNTRLVDLGDVNGKYFINVCAAGMLTNISQDIDQGVKNTFGKLAYYIKGIEQIPNFVPMSVRITGTRAVYEEDIYFFFALNTSGTGGFQNLSPGAAPDDGLFDFIAFKSTGVMDLARVFVRVLTGDYLDDNNIIFFRDSYIKVEITEGLDNPLLLGSDIDGEAGPDLPVEIRNLRGAFKIFAP